jgi:hypothetical protein
MRTLIFKVLGVLSLSRWMIPTLSALLLLASVAMCIAGESLSENARWPALVAQAKDRGIDYPAVAARADRGDAQALSTLFRLTPYTDASGAESHSTVLRLLLQHLGDRRFSLALRRERSDIRNHVTKAIDFDFSRPWQKSFPLTYALGSHDRSSSQGE